MLLAITMLSRLAILLALVAPASAAPKVVTQAWLRDFSKWQLAALIDGDQGLAVLTRVLDSPVANDHGVVSAERLCGEKLEQQLPTLRAQIADALKRSDTKSCHNRPGPAYCAFGIANEYTTMTYLVFRPSANGELTLDAVMALDGGSMDDAAYDKQRAWVSHELTKLRSTSCSGKATTPPSYEQFVDAHHAD